MKHLIVGYGYCGYYLAKELLKQKHKIWTLSRHSMDERLLDNVNHITADVSSFVPDLDEMNVIHYMIAPPRDGQVDYILRQYLSLNKVKARKIIYYGSSGVYGCQEGQVTTETTPCNIKFDRQYRRLDAEKALIDYGEMHNLPVGLLRIAGIIGADRIPTDKVEYGSKVIKVSQAPWSNSIYIEDLVKASYLISKKLRTTSIFNISDGIANPLGSTHRLLAILMHINQVYEQDFDEAFENASPMGREFLISSKKLSIDKLKKFLGEELILTDKIEVLKQSLSLQLLNDEITAV